VSVYLYGILRAADALRPPREGVDGRAIRRVERGELAALVSEVGDEPIKASRRNLNAHAKALQEVAVAVSVLPVQFGVVLPGDDCEETSGDLLERHAETLGAELDAIDGLLELDVKVLCAEETLLHAIVAGDARLARAAARLQGADGHATYYERIELGEAIAREVAARREAVVQKVLDELGHAAADAIVIDAAHDEMLANVAFLVDRERIAAFDGLVEKLAASLGDRMRVRALGPLPPYRFVDLALQEDEAWA
jgi:Gas vesicle synthesis protein GvpL/GvpF